MNKIMMTLDQLYEDRRIDATVRCIIRNALEEAGLLECDDSTKNQEIFLVYSCDEWASTDSMRLILTTTSVNRLKEVVAKMILDGDFVYNDEYSPCEEQASDFQKDFDNRDWQFIEGRLKYGFISFCYDGELQD